MSYLSPYGPYGPISTAPDSRGMTPQLIVTKWDVLSYPGATGPRPTDGPYDPQRLLTAVILLVLLAGGVGGTGGNNRLLREAVHEGGTHFTVCAWICKIYETV